MDEQEKLVQQMQQGDAAAFEWIFQQYQNQLLRTAYLITGNHADSEDIVQETFVKCYCNCRKLRDPSVFSTWLYQILTRTAWRYGKKQKRETPVEQLYEQGEPGSGNPPLEQMLMKEMQKELYGKIMKLNQKQRTVIILYYYNQLSTREISRIVGCLEGTVKSRLYTARKMLEQGLREEQIEWTDKSLTL